MTDRALKSPVDDSRPDGLRSRVRRRWRELDRGWQASVLGLLAVAVAAAL